MIKILSKNVADKIAAGEVVDRPLSIVKELVENSIDSGATAITVEIKNGGKSYIRITDNGCGIHKEEVLLAFMRHATSKINMAEDLEHIYTLGFRGEALASIAAVSRVELVTKVKEAKTGTKLKLEGGTELENMETGCPDGTTIIVSDLFYNTPARLKFMKNDSTEASLIIDFVSKIALAYSDVQIRLINNGMNLFTTLGKGDMLKAIQTIYSKDISEGLIPIKGELDFIRINGFISKPHYTKTNKKHQIFFVNGRVISSKIIEKGLMDSYFDKIFDGRFPIAFLFININPSKVDVNIHPNKKEVRFDDEKGVIEFISNQVRNHLNSINNIPEIKEHKKSPFTKKTFKKEESSQVDIKQLLSTRRQEENKIHEEKTNYIKEEYITNIQKPFDFKDLNIVGTIFSTYILANIGDCMYLIDQHAAHERIFYENLLKQYYNKSKEIQNILTPFIVNVSYTIKESSKNLINVLIESGYDIEEFGPKAYRISGIPSFMNLLEAENYVIYFLENINQDIEIDNKINIEKIISNSCKAAIKAGDHMKSQEIQVLIQQLDLCENPYSCPHGRPTFIKITKYEIERMFKRV